MQRKPKAKTSLMVVEGRLLSKAEILELLGGVGYTSVYTWMIEQDFPRPIELGPPGGRSATIMWYAHEVHAWIASRPRRKLGRGEHAFRGRKQRTVTQSAER